MEPTKLQWSKLKKLLSKKEYSHLKKRTLNRTEAKVIIRLAAERRYGPSEKTCHRKKRDQLKADPYPASRKQINYLRDLLGEKDFLYITPSKITKREASYLISSLKLFPPS